MRALHLSSFERDAAALVDVLRTGPLQAPVSSCPGWDLAGLGAHVGQVHRWAAAALNGQQAPDEAPAADDVDVAAWVEEGAGELLRLMTAAPDDAACWGFGPPPQTAGFWVRRQAHETALHRWDAQVAARRPAALDPVLSWDGVAEVAEVFYPRQVALGRRAPLGAALELVAAEGEVVVGEGPPVARVHGPSSALLLVVWGRRRAIDLVADGTLRAEGDAATARRLLSEQLVP
ncbi:maleylpyruvate isomerase family mycothiol-dependent enzyme [Angustibacter aerolatus]